MINYKVLGDSADTYYIYKLAQHIKIVICADISAANRIYSELVSYGTNMGAYILRDWETLPWDDVSANINISSSRIHILDKLLNEDLKYIIMPLSASVLRLPPKDFIANNLIHLIANKKYNINSILERIKSLLYIESNIVKSRCEYMHNKRNNSIHICTACSDAIYNLEFNQQKLIRITSSESNSKIDELRIIPTKDFILSEKFINSFRLNYRNIFSSNSSNSQIYKSISKGIIYPGIEYYLSLFFNNELSNIAEYIKAKNCILVLHGDINKELSKIYEFIDHRSLITRNKDILEADKIFIPRSEILKILPAKVWINPPKELASAEDNNLSSLKYSKKFIVSQNSWDFINASDKRIVIAIENSIKINNTIKSLKSYAIDFIETPDLLSALKSESRIALCRSNIHFGFEISALNVLVISCNELFNIIVSSNSNIASKNTITQDSLNNIKAGKHLVHVNHGLGKYNSLQIIRNNNIEEEFLVMDYANDNKLYTPISNLNLITDLRSAPGYELKLDILGSQSWNKKKNKIRSQLSDIAHKLIELDALRSTVSGNIFNPTDSYIKFCEEFKYIETDDQISAIADIVNDLGCTKPMDRLICGDIGFGKTEIAMRAAYIVASNGYQVAVLCPTTILVEQHYENFNKRFHNHNIKISMLSRANSSAEIKEILYEINNKEILIVIGTHKLIQDSISFNSLGLIIIDEEHKFGVKQKNLLQSKYLNVNTLAMSATPIPRSLSMAMNNVKSLSLISTPPMRRLSIKNIVIDHNPELIKEAISRELRRGGQVYLLHNYISSINQIAKAIKILLPETIIAIAHGKMNEIELCHVMSEFHDGKYNLLLSTTIIENGIDNPNANTIIINHADRFGISQLYQIRGRVGRSHHQAYSYMISNKAPKTTDSYIPDFNIGPKLSNLDTKKSTKYKTNIAIDIVANISDIGRGFDLSLNDLELRGTGEILGEEQTGHMQEVGYELYYKMLQDALKSCNGKQSISLEDEISINLNITSLIPSDYCSDVSLRINYYRQLSSADTDEKINTIILEMTSALGLAPDEVLTLSAIHRLRIAAQNTGIIKIVSNSDDIVFEFKANKIINPESISVLIKKYKNIKFIPNNQIKIPNATNNLRAQENYIKEFMSMVGA